MSKRQKPPTDSERANDAARRIIKDYSGLTIGAADQKIMTEQLFFRLRRELNAFAMKDWNQLG